MPFWQTDRSDEEPVRAMVFDIKYRAEFVEANELAKVGEELARLSLRTCDKVIAPRELETDTVHDMRRARSTVMIGYRQATEYLAAFQERHTDRAKHDLAECVYMSAAMAWQDTRRLIHAMSGDPYCSLNNRELSLSMINDMDKLTITIIDKTWQKVKDKLGKHERYRTINTFPPYIV